MSEILIVSRHAGAVEWLRQRGVVGDNLAHATPEIVRGRQVYGEGERFYVPSA